MKSYDDIARFVLRVMSKDLNIDEEPVWSEYQKIPNKYLFRPSSLIAAIIEIKYPEKKVLIDNMMNATPQTIMNVVLAISTSG